MRKELSRRDFMKGAAAASLGVAAMGILGACSTDTEGTKAPETNAPETKAPETQAPETTPAATEPVETEPAAEPDVYEIAATVDTEAVILGCGAAGLQAALKLAAAGVKTYLLEKGASCGVANGSSAGGPALAGTRVQKAENAEVTEEDLYKFMYGFSRGTVNGSLLRKCISKGEEVLSNFVDNGVGLGLMKDSYGVGFRARHSFSSEAGYFAGVNRFQPLVDKFEADGGKFEANREGVKLVMDGDVVAGVIAKNVEDGTYIQYNAKAVLIATGGYAGNDARIREHFGDISVTPLCNVLSTGQGYDMVLEAGGIADRNWALCCNEFGGCNTKSGLQGAMAAFATSATKFAIYGGLMVDGVGDRFMNEQYLSDRPLAQGGEMSLRVAKYYAVLDTKMYETIRDQGVLAYYGDPQDWYVGQTSLKTMTGIANLDTDTETAIGQGWVAKGTAAECAAVFGMKNLEETVKAYNEICKAGKDDQFYKDSYLLKELDIDNLYVFEYEPSIWCTFGGVKTDAYCRAVKADQTVIPGLYVAGVDNGSLYCSPYYENEGAALGTAYTSGIVAGEYMAEYVKGL